MAFGDGVFAVSKSQFNYFGRVKTCENGIIKMSFFVESIAKNTVLHKIVDKNFRIWYSISDI